MKGHSTVVAMGLNLMKELSNVVAMGLNLMKKLSNVVAMGLNLMKKLSNVVAMGLNPWLLHCVPREYCVKPMTTTGHAGKVDLTCLRLTDE